VALLRGSAAPREQDFPAPCRAGLIDESPRWHLRI